MLKHILSLFLVSVLIIGLLFGCGKKEYFPQVLSNEEAIKEIILSKGDTYNFLTDKQYMEYMDILGNDLVTNKEANPPHYTVGNLDDDNIPELVVFKERNLDDTEDEGSLDLYKFDGEKYLLLDSISMNYDNTNYQMVIGKISKDINGLLINNQVGAHSGITYGFIIEDNKLTPIFDNNKISLLSIYPNAEIKDIDNDGILEFSIYTIDPETEITNVSEADKMILWYKWNGKDGGDLVKFEKTDPSLKESSMGIRSLEMEDNISLDYLIENKDLLSRSDLSLALQNYIQSLERILLHKGIEIDYLFAQYEEGHEEGYLFEKYGLSLEKLNSLEYLSREKTLKDEIELKGVLLDNLDLGYILDHSKYGYHYILNYQKFLDLFGENISNEYGDYLKILASNSNEEFLRDGNLLISMDKLLERILMIEAFKMIYPYSEFLGELMELNFWYTDIYFYGDLDNPNFTRENLELREDIKLVFENTLEKYKYTNFSQIVESFYKDLESNNFILNDEIGQRLKDSLE